ncbi:MAG: A/G-specific adenine glycosylase [Proteobacteria bacterium]|nr:A/G-specific adenine glycosylase [Pseudomonadota bacterium]MDA1022351.1 A/G-specific adenine glycosylase [Pseudomonadota bacterium]
MPRTVKKNKAPYPDPDPVSVRRRLLAWYDAQGRDLPWRYKNGERPDPYRVWLSEIMLAQTTVATVKGYFEEFLRRWPKLADLAAADQNDVLHAWQGLGYYARARNLHKCARVLVAKKNGCFPDTEEDLRQLPGVGDYTAAAIAAIAFGRKSTPVDANIERVTARLFAIDVPLPGAQGGIKGVIKEQARTLTPAPRGRPGDFAQAMMDLGATLCSPNNPDCPACPLKSACLAEKTGAAERYPVKPAKKPRPVRHGMVFWAVRGDGAVLLRQRPEKGLLGGMMEIPSTQWRGKAWTAKEAAASAPVQGDWRTLDGVIRHTFTHFHLELTVLVGAVNGQETENGLWSPPSEFSDHALPTVMKKIARLVASYSS